MWDQTYEHGNELCLFGYGFFPTQASLSSWTRLICTGFPTWQCYYVGWQGAVRSFWAGPESGYFNTSTDRCDSWDPNALTDQAGLCTQAAIGITFTN